MPTKNSRLADFLPYVLAITSNALSGRIADEYRSRFGLRIPEWRIMAVLGDARALTQRDLVSATLMDKVAVNRACKVLEKRDLVARSPNDRDGRSHHLELTPAGRTLHEEVMPMTEEMYERIFLDITAAERAQMMALLSRIRLAVTSVDVGSGA